MPASLVLATLGPGDLLGLIADSTFFGKFILLVLLVLSVMSWAVFIDKARQLARIRAGHLEFWRQCEEWLDGRPPQAGRGRVGRRPRRPAPGQPHDRVRRPRDASRPCAAPPSGSSTWRWRVSSAT